MSASPSAKDPWLLRIAYWVAVVGFTVGAAVAAVHWSAAYSSANQYDQSPTCLFGDCSSSDVTEETVAVIDTGRTLGKDPSYWVDLSGLTPERKEVVLTNGGGVWPLLHPADEVTVTLWRGMITDVRNDKASSQAWDNPDFTSYNDYIALLLLAVPALALVIGPVVNRTKRMRVTGWFFSTWVVLAGFLYEACLIFMGELNFFLLPVSFAIVGLVMYPTVVVIGSRRARKKKGALGTRPARVP